MEITANVVVETVFTLPFGDGNTRHFLRKLFVKKKQNIVVVVKKIYNFPFGAGHGM